MNEALALYYQDNSGTWHIYSLEYQKNNGLEGYVFFPGYTEVMTLMTSNDIFLAKNDNTGQWFIPDIASNRQKLTELIEVQRQLFEASVKALYILEKSQRIGVTLKSET